MRSHYLGSKGRTTISSTAPKMAEHGIVRIQTQTIFLSIPYGKKTQPSYKWAKQLSLSVTAESLYQLRLTTHC
jgi:hypothetical protein